MPRSLFRKEAIDAQRQKFLGEASIAQPVRGWVYTATAVFIAALVVAVAVWGQYTRRERVQGYLSSAVGAAVVKVVDAGTITALAVKEGDRVKQGQQIGELTIDKSGKDDPSNFEAMLVELKKQRASREMEREQILTNGRQQIDLLNRRVESLQQQILASDAEVATQRERVKSANEIADLWKNMQGKEFVSPIYVQQKQDDARDQVVHLQGMLRSREVLKGELASMQAEVPVAKNRTLQQLEQIGQGVSQIQQQLAGLYERRGREVNRVMAITAPIDGVVTNINPSRGQTVAADATFATILPDNQLHAELLVPTRAIGFVHPGQDVTLRYDAFPYERFGQFHGEVENVGQTIWSQGEAVGPFAVKEPVYRIVVTIDKQSVAAGGNDFPLRAGMVASADLLMEKRTLLEWLFQPVIQLRERMRSGASSNA